MMKKIWAVLLSICLMISLAAPAMAAPIKTSGAASTLKLESVEGTAQLKDGSGKALNATKGSRLYNGYELSTQKSSYAFVSLDSSKAIKLDASTSAEVFQSGKKLEMKVNSGQMFFNVTEPLKSDEALNIRTSTMVTGVRGTSGWITVVDRYTTQVSLLEGTLTITSTDPLTGTQRTITIVGGQTATIVYHGKDKNYESEIIIEDKTIQGLIEDGTIRDEHIILTDTGLTVENLQEEDVPGFVAVEVKKDKELQQKIEANSPLSVPDIIGDAQQRLEKDKAAAEAEDKTIQEAAENLQADKVDPLFEGSTTTDSVPSGGGSSGGGSNSGGNDTPSDPPEVETTVYTLNLTTQTYYPANGGYSDTTNLPAETYEEGSVYEHEAPDGYIIYDIEGTRNWELSDDSTIAYILIDGNLNITITYAPQDEGNGDTGEDTTAYILTVVERIHNSDGSYSVPETVTNPGGKIAADVPYQLDAPSGYIIESVLGDSITVTYSTDRTSAEVTIIRDTEIEIIFALSNDDPSGDDTGDNTGGNTGDDTGDDTSDEYTQTLESPPTAMLYELKMYYSDLFFHSDTAAELGLTDLAQVEQYASFFPTVTFNITGSITPIGNETYDTVSLPANYVVNLSGTSSLESGATLDTADGTQLNVTNGTFTNNGTISGEGTLNVAAGATVDNNGDILIEHNESMHVSGTVNNYGSVTIGTANSVGALVVESGGQLNNLADNDGTVLGTLSIASGSTLTVSGTITTERRIENAGTMTVTGSIIGENMSSNRMAVYNRGTLTINGGTVSYLTEHDDGSNGNAIYSAGGTVTLNNGNVTGSGWGIRSTSANDKIYLNGGTVKGSSVGVEVTGTLEMTDGTVQSEGIVIRNNSGTTTVDGGTLFLNAGVNDNGSLINGSPITFNGGILKGNYERFIDVFTLGLESAIPVEQDDGTWVFALDNESTYTFTSFASDYNLAPVIADSKYKAVNLMAGGELTGETAATSALASGKTLSVQGGELTIGENAELVVSGKLTVSDGASILCDGILSSAEGSTIDNSGSIMLTNSLDLSQITGEEEKAEAMGQIADNLDKNKLLGAFTNSTSGILSVGSADKTGAVSDYGVLSLGGTVTNEGEIQVYSSSNMELSGDLTNNNILQNAGEIKTETGNLINNGSVRNTGKLTFYGNVINNNSISSAGKISVCGSAQLTNAANAVIHVTELNSRLEVYSSSSTAHNNGTIYVDEQSTMSNSGTFTNSGILYAAGSIGTSNVFTNAANGKLWVGYAATVDGTTDLLFCQFTNSRTLENLGEIYIAPDSMLKNHMWMYNAGTIELGNTGRYPAEVLSETLDDARLLNGEGNLGFGSFYNGRTADGNTASGTLELYSGELHNENHTSNHFLNVAAEGNNAGGVIHLEADATFSNGTYFNPAEGGAFYLNGIFYDEYVRDSRYVMIMDSNNDNLVVAYKGTGAVFTEDFTWTEGYTYRLNSRNGVAAAIDRFDLPAVTVNNVTLDLGGYDLYLESPLQVGEAIDSGSGEEIYTSGVTPGGLTITDTPFMAGSSSNHCIYVHNRDVLAANGTFNSHVVYVTAGTFNMNGGTLKMEDVAYGSNYGYWPITPLHVNPCGIQGSYGDEDFTFADVSVTLDGANIECDDTADCAIYVTNGGSTDGEKNCQITVTGGSTITSGAVGIDLYGQDIEVTIEDGSTLTSPSNGISVSAANTTINVDGEGTEITVGDANSTDCAGIINSGEGNSDGLEITVSNGAKISTADNTSADASCYGIVGHSAMVFIDGGVVSMPLEELFDEEGESIGGAHGITLSGSGMLIVSGDTSSVSGYYGIFAESGDSGNPAVIINGGKVNGTYAISGADTQIEITGGEIVGETAGITYYDSYADWDTESGYVILISGGSVIAEDANNNDKQCGIAYYYYDDMYHKIAIGTDDYNKERLVDGTYESSPSISSGSATVSGNTAAIIIQKVEA